MKRSYLIIIVCLGFFGIHSCDKKTDNPKNINSPDEKIITACGVTDPAKNLQWLAELIKTAEADETGNYLGRIWLEKFKEQDIFVTDMMLGSGGIMYYFFDCNGNHFIFHKEIEYCTACNFVGNHHVFIEDEDFQSFISNMKLGTVVYSPF